MGTLKYYSVTSEFPRETRHVPCKKWLCKWQFPGKKRLSKEAWSHNSTANKDKIFSACPQNYWGFGLIITKNFNLLLAGWDGDDALAWLNQSLGWVTFVQYFPSPRLNPSFTLLNICNTEQHLQDGVLKKCCHQGHLQICLLLTMISPVLSWVKCLY